MTPLRIAIDARELAGHVTGVGTYVLNLLRQWLPRDDVRVSLISHRDLSPEAASLPGIERAHRIVRPNAKSQKCLRHNEKLPIVTFGLPCGFAQR